MTDDDDSRLMMKLELEFERHLVDGIAATYRFAGEDVSEDDVKRAFRHIISLYADELGML